MGFQGITPFLLLSFTASIIAFPTKYYMSSNCVFANRFTESNVRVLLSPTNSYNTNMNCVMTVQTLTYTYLSVKFLKMDLQNSVDCQGSKLAIFDGPTTASQTLSPMGGICQRFLPGSLKTTSNSVTFQFTSDSFQHFGGFDMLVTPFSTGFCSVFDYDCFNGRCVSDTVTCNGYDNCGDDSDELDCGIHLSIGLIAGISVGCFVFFAVLFALVIVRIVRRRSYRVVTGMTSPTSQNYQYS